ncbi:glycosyltransferase family 4 protein [Demequina lignilytica]|uniref:Glycosyltransferase family 4 protein n=1 Tax=Demequina lignilytica TaxID=3051663 RepID=A0AB35MKG9_9MICO|nr:glycosyltransferase family 4 protein [Demequina sp. SYSU T0a273]MDN4484173.1 glycosyltransferase family 4 protein [Demequina sp. SYSU T0a273]
MSITAEDRSIAIVGINYPPERTGIAPYMGALAHGLAARGCGVRVVTAQPHYPEWRIHEGYHHWSQNEDDSGVEVHRRLHMVPKKPQGLPRLISELSFGARVSLDGGMGHPGAIVLVSPALFSSAVANLRARLRDRSTPVIIWVQDLYGRGMAETGGDGLVTKVVRRVEGHLLRRATRVVVIHERFKRAVVEDYGVDPENVVVVRNWTHLPAHAPIERLAARLERGWGDETVLLHAGNMGVKQGLDHVIAAARVAQDRGANLRFVLLGDGGERAKLEELAVGLDNVQFLDPLDDEAFRRALSAADALLVHEAPGISEMAVPSKLTSYFDAGRPVLAVTDLLGITAEEVRAAGAGIVVRSGDPDALIAGALRLGGDAALAERLGASGRAYRECVLSERAAVDAFAQVLGVKDRRKTRSEDSRPPAGVAERRAERREAAAQAA